MSPIYLGHAEGTKHKISNIPFKSKLTAAISSIDIQFRKRILQSTMKPRFTSPFTNNYIFMTDFYWLS